MRLTGALVRLRLEFCTFVKRLFYEKNTFQAIDCNAEAIRRSSWPNRYCMQKSEPDTQTHPTTVTLRRMRAEG